jgi:hypothetical protein
MKLKNNTLNDYNELSKKELERIKSLRLSRSKETQYDPWYRIWVPRARVIGCDGLVRTTRQRNEEPMSPPKDSDYSRLFSAFTKMRLDGAYAKWNISGNGYTDYWCNLPELKQPMITHYQGEIIYDDNLRTGMTWTKNWHCVQDNVFIDIQNDGLDIATKRLAEAGFNFKIIDGVLDPQDNIQMLNLIFRGVGCDDNDIGNTGFRTWTWIGNAMDGGPQEPPAVDC